MQTFTRIQRSPSAKPLAGSCRKPQAAEAPCSRAPGVPAFFLTVLLLAALSASGLLAPNPARSAEGEGGGKPPEQSAQPAPAAPSAPHIVESDLAPSRAQPAPAPTFTQPAVPSQTLAQPAAPALPAFQENATSRNGATSPKASDAVRQAIEESKGTPAAEAVKNGKNGKDGKDGKDGKNAKPTVITADKANLVSKPRGLRINVGASAIINTDQDIARVSVASPDVADFVLLSPRQLYMTGKAIGATNLTLWNKDSRVFALYDLDVAPDTARLKRALHDALPEENGIRVSTANDFLTLSGSAKSPESVTKALSLAEAFAPKRVINLMAVGGMQQVQLEVKVAEASKSVLKRFGINFANQSVSAGNTLLNRANPLGVNEGVPNSGDITRTVENFRSFFRQLTFLDSQGRLLLSPNLAGVLTLTTDSNIFTAYIDALKEDGHIRILAEPNLMCLSGQTADFLAGGEIPVPVPQGLGTVAIEWKQFGVALKFTPTVLDGKRINLQVNPEISELDFANAITISNFQVPAITTRRAKTIIDLNDGQTFAIAGMLRDTSRQNFARYPLIGDIPVLGMLFRSDTYRRDETELVIFVTPRLAKPLDMAGQTLPTDEHRTPPDLDFYLLGMTSYGANLFRPGSKSVAPPATMTGRVGLDGAFGHLQPEGVK